MRRGRLAPIPPPLRHARSPRRRIRNRLEALRSRAALSSLADPVVHCGFVHVPPRANVVGTGGPPALPLALRDGRGLLCCRAPRPLRSCAPRPVGVLQHGTDNLPASERGSEGPRPQSDGRAGGAGRPSAPSRMRERKGPLGAAPAPHLCSDSRGLGIRTALSKLLSVSSSVLGFLFGTRAARRCCRRRRWLRT
jgi:hypothetical protein